MIAPGFSDDQLALNGPVYTYADNAVISWSHHDMETSKDAG